MLRKMILLAAYAATVPVANWMIDNVGTQHFPGGPHTIPVGFGYDAPSGVLLIGLALVLRDAIHRVAGKSAALAAIGVGVVLSFVFADPAIATASAVAFALSELLDFAVYTPLAERKRFSLAVLFSGALGAVADSLIFLQIAFGSTMFWQGQVIGKLYFSVAAAIAIYAIGRWQNDDSVPVGIAAS